MKTLAPVSLAALFILAFAGAPLGAQTGWTPPEPVLSVTTIPAEGATVVMTIQARGRYALWTESETGSLIAVHDPMNGLLAQDGVPRGTTPRNGRVDLFLDAGRYQVVVEPGSPKGARLRTRAFSVVNAREGFSGVSPLPEDSTWDGQIADFQMAAFWVDGADSPRSFHLEATGRSVAGISLWEDGVWETGRQSSGRTLQIPVGARALSNEARGVAAAVERIDVGAYEFSIPSLEGRHLALVYGGPSRFAPDNRPAQSARVRRGYTLLGDQGSMDVEIGATGVMTWMLGQGMGTMEVLPQGSLPVQAGLTQNLDQRYGASLRTSGSTEAQKRITLTKGSSPAWFVLMGVPGQKVSLLWTGTTINSSGSPLGYIQGFGDGEYYLNIRRNLASADRGDLSLSALTVVNSSSSTTTYIPQDQRAALLTQGSLWYQEVNNTSPNSFILNVGQAGRYSVVDADPLVTATYRFQPLEDLINGSDTRPLQVGNGGTVTLSQRIWVLTVTPDKTGTLKFALMGGGADRNKARQAFTNPPVTRRGLSTLVSDPRGINSLMLITGNTGAAGYFLRRLPLDLDQGLVIDLEPGQSLGIPVKLATRSWLPALEGRYTAQLNGRPWAPTEPVPAGNHTLTFTAPANAPLSLTISPKPFFDLAAFKASSPAELMAAYTTLTVDRQEWKDFDRSQTRSFLLRVDESGPWALGTEGRLRMALWLDSPGKPGLFSATANAGGGNALIEAYLSKGIYRFRVQPQQQSMGRAGVYLSRPPVVSGVPLTHGSVGRLSVAAGSFSRTPLVADRIGQWSIDPLVQGGTPQWRLEDDQGFIVGSPVNRSSAIMTLKAGRYHLVQYPSPLFQQRLLAFERLPDPDQPVLSGGAYRLEINRTAEALWRESPERQPQYWTYDSPGWIRASLNLSEGMEVLVQGPGEAEERLIKAENLGTLDLTAGTWRFGIRSTEEDDRRTYQLGLQVGDLVPGTSTGLTQGRTSFVVPREGLVELLSLSRQLWDLGVYKADGTFVALGSPIEDDWNTRVVVRLEPGRYTLQASPAGTSGSPRTPSYPDHAPPGRSQQRQYYDEEGYGEEYNEYYEDESYDEEWGQSLDTTPTRPGPAAASTVAPVDIAPAPRWVDGPRRLLDTGAAGLVKLSLRSELALPSRDVPNAGAPAISLPLPAGDDIVSLPLRATREGPVLVSVAPVQAAVVEIWKNGTFLARGQGSLALPLGVATYEVRAWFQAPRAAGVSLTVQSPSVTDLAPSAVVAPSAITTPLARLGSGSRSLWIDRPQDLWVSPGIDRPFMPLEGPRAILAPAAWIHRRGPDGLPASLGSLSGGLLSLEAGLDLALPLAQGRQGVEFVVPEDQVALVRAQSNAWRPGLHLQRAGGAEPREWGASPGFWRATEHIQAALGGTWTAQVWDSRTGAQGPGMAEPVLSALGLELLPLGSPIADTDLARGLELSPRSARVYIVPRGIAALDLILEGGLMAAQFDRAGQSPALLVLGADQSLSRTLEVSEGQRVLIMNPGTRTAWASLVRGSQAPAGPGPEWESTRADQTPIRVAVEESAGNYLWILGPSEAPSLYTAREGQIHQATAYDSIPGIKGLRLWRVKALKGMLAYRAGADETRHWIGPNWSPENNDAFGRALFGRATGLRESRLEGSTLTLGGGMERVTLALAKPSVVTISADRPGIYALEDPRGRLVNLLALGRAGEGNLVINLTAGTWRILARPWTGDASGARLVVSTLEPLPLRTDGYGPMALLRPGETVLYQIDLSAPSRLGLAVQATDEVLNTRLFDQDFKELGSGPVLFRSLPAGRYWWLVEGRDTTVRYRVAGWGIEGTRSEIPAEIRQQYTNEE